MTRNRKLLIGIGLIVILSVLVIYRYGFLPLTEGIHQIRDEREIKVKTLTKYRSLISEQDGLKEEIVRLRNLLKDEELKLVTGDTPALASASLQGMIKQIISEKGATITSERVGRTKEFDGYRGVSVGVDMSVDSISALSDIIYDIESRTPYMVIKELSIRVRHYRKPSQLTVRLKILGLSSS